MYFVWVKFAAPLEVLAHRIVWSVPLLALLITVGRQWSALRVLSMRQLRLLAACSVLLSINWLSFIFAIHTERIAEAALGYYINPLVSIVLGFVVLAERLRPTRLEEVLGQEHVTGPGRLLDRVRRARGRIPFLPVIQTCSPFEVVVNTPSISRLNRSGQRVAYWAMKGCDRPS